MSLLTSKLWHEAHWVIQASAQLETLSLDNLNVEISPLVSQIHYSTPWKLTNDMWNIHEHTLIFNRKSPSFIQMLDFPACHSLGFGGGGTLSVYQVIQAVTFSSPKLRVT